MTLFDNNFLYRVLSNVSVIYDNKTDLGSVFWQKIGHHRSASGGVQILCKHAKRGGGGVRPKILKMMFADYKIFFIGLKN